MVDTAPAAPSGPPAASGPASQPATDAVIQSQRAPLRAETLARLQAMNAPAAVAPAIVASAVAAPGATPPAEPVVAAPAVDAAPAEPATPVVAPPAEPAGMAAVRKAEQHARRQLADERAKMVAEFDTQRTEWKAKVDRAAAIDAAATNARRDPIGALRALGFTDEDFEPLGRTLYGASPAGQKDPRYKASGEAALAQREQLTAVQRLEAQIKSLTDERAAEKQQAVVQSQLDTYADGVLKEITDSTPIAKSALAKNPAKVRAALLEVADRLYTESGPSHDLRDIPDAAAVLAAYEAERIAELELYGVDPSTLARPAAPKVPAAPPVKPPTATLAPGGGTGPTIQATGAKPTREEALVALRKIRDGAAS